MIGAALSLARALLTGSLWRWPLALLRWPVSLLRWIAASPTRIWAALAFVALALAAWQAHRASTWAAKARATQTAWMAERKDAQATKLAAEAKSRKDAQDADTIHTALVQGGPDRFAAYAAGHGLRQSAPAHRAPAAPDNPPAILADTTPEAIMADISRVWISRADWLTCDADYAYAQAAHDWGKRIAE